MGLLGWMRRALAGAERPGPAARTSRSGSHDQAPYTEPPPALPSAARGRAGTRPAAAERSIPARNLDCRSALTVVLDGKEAELLWRLSQRIEAGRFTVPQIQATALAALDLAGRPSTEVPAVVELIAKDPLLTSELLRLANSTLYAGGIPVQSLHDAVVRVGLRALRGLIFSASLRSALFKESVSAEYAAEVWRQSASVARLARAIAPGLGQDGEQAYLLGLLQDIGKVALLSLLGEEGRRGSDLTTALVGQVFHALHEKAGAAMAQAWKLPETVASVVGSHHEPALNREHPREAALALLAHQLDLHASLGDELGFEALREHPTFDVLGADAALRTVTLDAARAELELFEPA
jgi:putative nucleotidyltransferase with HDIG domain